MISQLQKLHLGCFDQVFNGWINTDITPHIFLSKIPFLPFLFLKIGIISEQRYLQYKQGMFSAIRYLNVTKRFPFDDAAFDFVFCSHLLEHLYPEQAIFCINETFRVLKRDGIVRIVVPDLDKIMQNYDSQKPEKFLEALFESKQKYSKNRHHWHYNESSLTRILKKTGFSKIYRCEFREGRCADVTLIDNRPKSLFMEAVK